MRGLLHQINRSNGGLPKRAIPHPVMLNHGGIEGDRQRNLMVHGGPDKAVLMIAAEMIDSLAAGGFPIYYGALGENLTVTGLDPHQWRAGQRYRIGPDALIELTKLRSPCTNLDVYGPSIKAEIYDAQCKAGDIASPHWAHGGFYARVIHAGLLFPGAPVILETDAA
ncbi:MAG TPA: MOSC domain-containing protein [Bryobacteraceae bacterium]|jgi:MOSC domain-containing protein YiiM|nr:MOSC domain-containing protein [Bryobacteraceae bacterium]